CDHLPLIVTRLRTSIACHTKEQLTESSVSNQTRTSLLYISEKLNVDHRVYPSADENRKCISICATRLDDYFSPGDRVDLIKLDIQGYELHALQGAERVLDTNREIKLVLEFWPYGLTQAGVGW